MPASSDSPDRLRVLQIGAGAMGTRRLRDLSARDDVEVRLFDRRDDRRRRAAERFGVEPVTTLDDGLAWAPDALIISTPPDAHDPFIEIALERGIHHFCEENIWTYDHRVVDRASRERGLVNSPSCSFHFLPLVRELERVVREELGDLHAYQMLLSTYLPNWHPDEGPEFYARSRSTAAAREMVPFELVWLNRVFGAPTHVMGTVRESGRLDNASEDTWNLQMDIDGGGVGQLVVGHASPMDHRSGMAIGTNGRVAFDVFAGTITRELPELGITDTRDVGSQAADLEAAYATEIATFVDAVRGAAWPHDYLASSIATGALAAAEASAITGRRTAVDPDVQPARMPGHPETPQT